MASSSSSGQRNLEFNAPFESETTASKRRKVSESSKWCDVFINHRGPDVKVSIAKQLFNSLAEMGIRAFLDSGEMEHFNPFPSIIETAMESASIHIPIFSKGYADSPWCLDELVLMLQSKAKIIPVFYEMDPWELRQVEKGTYAEAFMTYENEGRYLEKLNEWKEALYDVSFITPLSKGHCDDSSLCKKAVSAVLREIQKPLHTAKYPVGLDLLVEDFEISCDLMQQAKKVKIVGIFGMGGVGKTTLAKELFNRKRTKYDAASILFDVGKVSVTGQLPSLQMNLYKDLLHEAPPEILNVTEGKDFLKSRLQMRRSFSFLIVIDDVDHVDQLDALMITQIQKQDLRNSLVIITTRDQGVLKRAEITHAYHLKEMDRYLARELFCLHALQQPTPADGYEDLVDAFINVCGGLPLSLEVLGGQVNGKPRDYWQLELEKLFDTLPIRIKEELGVSLNTLNNEEKEAFMDIACFFVDKPKNLTLRVWEGSGWNALHALQTLSDKCLLEVREWSGSNGSQWNDDRAILTMHDHLRDLGREMANERWPLPRLWRPQDLRSLELKGGFRNILRERTTGRCFHSFFDISMGSQITYFLGDSKDCDGKSASLLWLEIDLNWNVHTNIPSWIPLHNLQCLRIRNGRLKRLWENNIKAPLLLKELHLSGTFMEECPNLSGMSNQLEKLVLNAEEMPFDGWSLLESLGVRVRGFVLSEDTLSGDLASNSRRDPKSLVLSNFKLKGTLALATVPSELSSLENIEISRQNLVSVISINGNDYNNLKSLQLYHMENLFQLDLSCLTKLKSLKLKHCNKLKRVSGISDLVKLEELDIRNCPEFNGLPTLSGLECLEKIEIDKCKKLSFLELKGCKNLKNLSGLSYLTKLSTLNILDCPQLAELPTLAFLNCLETIKINGSDKLDCLELYCCENLTSISGMSNLVSLQEFGIYYCSKLEELPSLAHLNFLEEITITECGKLQTIALPTSDLTKLVTLIITECPELKELSLCRLNCLERVTVNRCEKLQDITGIGELQRLKNMQLSMGSNLAVRNCIHSLQSVPSEFMTATGRASHQADSILNISLLSDLKGTGAVSRIPTEKKGSGFVEASLDLLEILPESGSLSAIILCVHVVVEDSCEDSVYIGFRGRGAIESWIFEEVQIDRGNWIVTVVITDQVLIARYIDDRTLGTVEITLDEPRGIKDGWILTVNKGEEWRTLRVLNSIVELYDK